VIRFIAATKNKGKLEEIEDILAGLPIKVISMQEAGFNMEIEETGTTFEENALIKARTICRASGEASIADDSGLEVDYLDGAPGIYSSRYGGEGATDADKNVKLLAALKEAPYEKRTARFISAIAVAFPDGRSFTVRGSCEGYIGLRPEGTNGFGYDPLFFIPEYNMTMAELSPEIKNRISHRAAAMRLMAEELKNGWL
jgi:XTP/dITP diphosphohydrolase